MEHLYRLVAACAVLFQLAVQSNLKIRGSHQPLLPVLTEERQESRIDASSCRILTLAELLKNMASSPLRIRSMMSS